MFLQQEEMKRIEVLKYIFSKLKGNVNYSYHSIFALVGLIFFSVPSESYAVITDNLTIGSAKAMSLGNAVTADPPGIDSTHYNPAGLASIKGAQKEVKVIAALFDISMQLGDRDPDTQKQIDDHQNSGHFPASFTQDDAYRSVSHTEGAAVVLPGVGLINLPLLLGAFGGLSYSPPGSDMTFSTSAYAPFFLGFTRAEDDPGRFMGTKFAIVLVNYFTPSVAIKM